MPFNEEQQERRDALFGILGSLSERVDLLVYEDETPRRTQRLWKSWEEGHMREWCRREDFGAALPELLRGEDEECCALLQASPSRNPAGR